MRPLQLEGLLYYNKEQIKNKAYPYKIGPYKIGLLVIERDAAGRLPFGWKRTDRK